MQIHDRELEKRFLKKAGKVEKETVIETEKEEAETKPEKEAETKV